MTKREENKLSMFETVISVLDANAAKYSEITALTESADNFKSVLGSIKEKDYNFKGATKGATAGKNVSETALQIVILKLSSVLYAYAVKNNKPVLKEETKLTRTALEDYRDTEFANKANHIISLAVELQIELAAYGITEQFITDAQSKLADYSSAVTSQGESFAKRSAEREEMKVLFNKADDIVEEELDLMLELFIDTEPNFYNEYKSARVIKDLGIKKSELVAES